MLFQIWCFYVWVDAVAGFEQLEISSWVFYVERFQVYLLFFRMWLRWKFNKKLWKIRFIWKVCIWMVREIIQLKSMGTFQFGRNWYSLRSQKIIFYVWNMATEKLLVNMAGWKCMFNFWGNLNKLCLSNGVLALRTYYLRSWNGLLQNKF